MKMFVKVYVSAAPSDTLSLSLSLSVSFTIYDAFWNSIKNECVWHRANEERRKVRQSLL